MIMDVGRSVDVAAYRQLLVWAFGVALAVLFVWFAWEVVLFVFAGVLLATILCAFTDWVKEETGLSRRASFAVVVIATGTIIAGSVWALAPRVIAQLVEITHVLPESVRTLRDALNQYESGRYLTSFVQRVFANMDVAAKLGTLATAAMDAVVGLIVVLVVGFFVALEPDTYIRGALAMFPEPRRGRLGRILSEVGHQLKWWLLGQLVPMVVLGVGTMAGLWLLGVPLAFTLGLFTAVMIFVPYLGSVISAVPAALVGLMQGPMEMVWVVVLFTAVHLLEGYIITPLAQKRAVRLPPALTITAQVLMWSLTGPLGMALATPIAAAAIVIVKMLYLHERPEH